MTATVAFLRVFFIGGRIAYRALFNWIRPEIYIPTMLIGPIFQILFFAYLGRYSGLENDAFFVVGNAVQASAMSGVYAATMAISNERQFQTLSSLLATPANRFAIFMGRALPVVLSGLLVSGWGFLMGRLLLDFHPPLSSVPALALVVVVSVVSCTAFGMTLGSVGMRARDVFITANIAYQVMWLLCGVNIPLDRLPGWMEQIGRLMPLTHGIAAAREVAAGGSLGAASGLVWTELAVGAAYAAIAFALVRYFEFEGRRRASLETY
jgi:ABC-2 type transport system permease protein